MASPASERLAFPSGFAVMVAGIHDGGLFATAAGATAFRSASGLIVEVGGRGGGGNGGDDAQAARLLVAEFFRDLRKTDAWFRTPNPQLGGISPDDLIGLGRPGRLLAFVRAALDENRK